MTLEKLYFCLFLGISFALSHVVQTGPEFPMQLKVIDPELLILLSLSLKCWGYKHEPSHPVCVLLGTKPGLCACQASAPWSCISSLLDQFQ